MIPNKLNELIPFLETAEKINHTDSFELAKVCNRLLFNKSTEFDGRDLLIRILDHWEKIDKNTSVLWNDTIEAAGLYPYIENNFQLDSSSALRKEFHKSRFLNDIYLHEQQLNISIDLQATKSVVVSAPTSFGKSLLIEEIIASTTFNNIVIIQPTLALLDETRKKLKKYNKFYNFIVSTKQNPTIFRNVYLFTAERVVEYQEFSAIDFFVIDEFYKLSMDRDDERAAILNQAFYKLSKLTNNFYMLGPNIRSIPQGFIDKYSVNWYKSDFSTVSVDVIPVDNKSHGKKRLSKSEKYDKENILFNLLYSLKEPTLIYCSSPEAASNLAINYLTFLQSKKNPKSTKNEEMIEWISENIHDNWALKDSLEYQIAFHHGAIPRHLGSSIVDAFNEDKVMSLFCTSTLIEGVNTSAKNVVLYDEKKGMRPIDYFDYMNIVGRSGRMKRHFKGRVFEFNPKPKQLEFDVDLPFFTQENAPLELLVHLDNNDLNSNSKKKIEKFNKLDEELKYILKKNSSLPIEGQLNIVMDIEKNTHKYVPLLNWRNYPNFEQLNLVLKLAWENLFKEKETKANVRSYQQLTMLALQQSQLRSLKALININVNSEYWIKKEPELKLRTQKIIQFILQVLRHWFDYKLPKFLTVVSDLQEYVLKSRKLSYGNYYFFASQFENDFLNGNLASLLEYDIPSSAIKKISSAINSDLPINELIESIKKINLEKFKLLPYEKNKIKSIY